jgi:hypothetical protein
MSLTITHNESDMELNEPHTTAAQSAAVVIGERNQMTNGSTPSTPQRNHEDRWDRVPMLSRMNSMECWDYTIELECLNGPQG